MTGIVSSNNNSRTSGIIKAVGGGITGWDSDNSTGNNDLLPDSASAGIYLGVNSATAANLLDDYETGTWDIVCSTADVTVSTTYDKMAYTKIGRLVNVYGRFRFSASTSPSADLGFTGLPFVTTSSLGEDANHMPCVAYMKNAASSVNNGIVGFISGTGVTAFQIIENCTTGAGEDVAAHVDTGTLMAINLTYFTA